MASKVYTAKELRAAADLREAWGDKDEVNNMLRQAADMIEYEEKCQYQYAARFFYTSGVIATDHIFDNPRDAKYFSGSRDGAKKIICRRKVGEWEKIKIPPCK